MKKPVIVGAALALGLSLTGCAQQTPEQKFEIEVAHCKAWVVTQPGHEHDHGNQLADLCAKLVVKNPKIWNSK